MDLKPLSPELNELRNVVISSNLASCYLVLELLKSEKNETLNYEKFRDQWIDIYKSTYGIVSKMKPRKSSRQRISRLNLPLPKGDFWTKGKADVEEKSLRKSNNITLGVIIACATFRVRISLKVPLHIPQSRCIPLSLKILSFFKKNKVFALFIREHRMY